MLGTERLLADRQGALVVRSCNDKIALVREQVAEVTEALDRIEMFRAERPLVDRKHSLAKRPRRGEVALVSKQGGEVVEACCRVRMLMAERLVPNSQRPLEERSRLRIGGAHKKIAAGPVQKIGAFLVRSSVSHFRVA